MLRRRWRAAACAAGAALTLLPLTAAHASAGAGLRWRLLDTGSTSHFRGLALVNWHVAWVSGYDGVVLRTVDAGRTWSDVSVPGAASLQFRDIAAFDARHAVVMAAGTGTDSRLYVTSDGGARWRLAYQNRNAAAFFDCMAFFNRRAGLVLSDPVNGKFRILATADGGRHWTVRPSRGMPRARPAEYGFAASGQCLTTSGRNAWFGTGGPDGARVFRSGDRGLTWHARRTPIRRNASSGVFGLAFDTPRHGIAVGGDYARPGIARRVSAVWSYRHHRWYRPGGEPHGYRSGVTFVPGSPGMALAVGLTGSDVSSDYGRHWHKFDNGQFDTVACTPGGACWASGDLGRVAVLRR